MDEQTAEAVMQTAETVAAVVAATGPKAAVVVALADAAIDLLQKAIDMQKAGVIQPDALAALFQSVGQGIQAKHAEWAAM